MRFKAEEAALVLIDLQRGFVDEEGFVAVQGRDVSASKRAALRCVDLAARARAAGPGSDPGQSATRFRSIPIRASRRAKPCWGWVGAASARRRQLSSSASRSRQGSTTRPRGMPATTASRSAVAGMLPVEPAAITGPGGGAAIQRAAWAASRRLRRSAGSIAPSSARRAGQRPVTRRRKSKVICQCSA